MGLIFSTFVTSKLTVALQVYVGFLQKPYVVKRFYLLLLSMFDMRRKKLDKQSSYRCRKHFTV